MQWWNDLINWVNSDAGWRIISGAIIPFVAIVIAGLIAAAAARSGARRAIAQQNSERAAAAVAAMIHAGRSATRWSALSGGQRERAEAEFIGADVQLRLLALNGSGAAADWATHELGSMRRDSASFSFQAEQTYVEFRDRLLEWQAHPNRARKLFALDLERFGLEDQSADAELVEQQRRWAAEEAAAAAVVTTPEPVAAEEPAPVRAVPYTATAIAPEIVADPIAEPTAPEPISAPPASDEAEPVEDPSPTDDESAAAPASAAPASWSLHAPATPPAPTTPLVVSTPHEPTPLVEPESTPSPTNPPTGPIERRPIETYGE